MWASIRPWGFLHTPRSAAYPLALDLMELFQTTLWDMPLIASLNRRQWNDAHFSITRERVWLSADGRKLAIGIYEERKQEHWRHPVLHYSLSYARAMELEVRLLEKEWTGKRARTAVSPKRPPATKSCDHMDYRLDRTQPHLFGDKYRISKEWLSPVRVRRYLPGVTL